MTQQDDPNRSGALGQSLCAIATSQPPSAMFAPDRCVTGGTMCGHGQVTQSPWAPFAGQMEMTMVLPQGCWEA